MSSFHNSIGDALSPLQGEHSSQFDYGGFMGGFGQNGDYYDQHPDELPQSQRPPTEESQRPDASLPGGETQMLQYALGSHNSAAKGPNVGPSRSLAGLIGSQASLDALESQVPTFRRKSNLPKKKIASSPPDPNWKMPSNVLNLHETPQRTPSYPSLHSNSNYRPNYEETSTKRGSGVFSQSGSNSGTQEPTHALDSPNGARVPISQSSAIDPVTSLLTGALSAPSPIFPVEPIGLQSTQTLVHATPSPPRPGPQPASSALPAPSAVDDTTTPLASSALVPILEAAPTAALTRQETEVIPETPHSDQDLPQVHQMVPIVDPPLSPPVVEYQGSFVIPEPQTKALHAIGSSSPRKRSAPGDFEEPPTPTKKHRKLSNGSRKSARVGASRVGAMRGKQEATSPPKSHAPTGKLPGRVSSPPKAIMAPRTSMWDETFDDGFGRKAAETAAKTKKVTKPPVRSLSDFGESQLVPIAVITPSGKTRPIGSPSTSRKKTSPNEVADESHPKKKKGRATMRTDMQAKAQLEESESMTADRRKRSTRSTVAVKDIPSSRRARKTKLGAATEALTMSREEEAVETDGDRKALKSSKSKKDVSPDLIPAPTSTFRLDIPTRKGQKRKLDEEEGDGPSSETPPKKKRKALHAGTRDEAPPKLSRKRKTSLDPVDTDTELPQPPSKKRRNVQVIANEESSENVTHTRANAVPLASLPHAQSFADTTTSLRSASQAPNRVFAKWAGNGMYYCGTLKKIGKRVDGIRVCTVEYDDGEVAQVPLEGLRRCEVWVGDVVEVPASKGKIRKSATVASVDDWEEHGRVRVSVAKNKGKSAAILEEVDIESRDVSVLATQAEADVSWTRRRLSAEDVDGSVPVEKGNHEDGDGSYRDHAEKTTQETSGASPTTRSRLKVVSSTKRTTRTAVNLVPVSKSVVRSTRRTLKVKNEPYSAAAAAAAAGSKSNREMTLPFAGDAFLIALTISGKSTQRILDSDDRERTKRRLQESITNQGGVCIEDWNNLFQVQGTVYERRWVWEKAEDINYSRMQAAKGPARKRSKFDRVWVLADGPNNNTKYFTALALGVPCVGSRWVEDGAKYPWSSYLLPAGHSSILGQECVQIVNYDYANCPRTIKQLIDDPGSVRKPFAGKSLLFVDALDKREKNFEADFEENHPLPIIACLMGPARVEFVHDIKHKSLDVSSYDIIIWDTTPPTDFVKAHSGTGVIITTESWVKECLWTGALLEV